MPRKGRIDAPGAIHHVTTRGLDRLRIFRERVDYAEFISRLGRILNEGGASCIAWSLMPNHVHLVVRTGGIPLSRMMHRLFLGYSVQHNNRLGRKGHLFEGRFRSILCDEEPYLLELVRYVHLNPIRGGICAGLGELTNYPWSGHRCILGRGIPGWQDVEVVLSRFGKGVAEARQGYLKFCVEGLRHFGKGPHADEELRRLVEGGWETVKRILKPDGIGTTESIMGRESFVSRSLKAAEDRERWKSRLRRRVHPADVLARAAAAAGITVGDSHGPGKQPAKCRARALACYWLVDVLGRREAVVGRMLGITQSAVSINVRRGRGITEAEGLSLEGK